MVRYFAYGHNTNSAEMIRRIPLASFVGKACLPNYSLVMRAFADIVTKKGDKVYGVLWDIPSGWISELDEIEADYDPKNVFVKWMDSRVKAMVYLMTRKHKGPPTQKYVNYIKKGYIEHALPLTQLTRAPVL